MKKRPAVTPAHPATAGACPMACDQRPFRRGKTDVLGWALLLRPQAARKSFQSMSRGSPRICACVGVKSRTILRAIKDGPCPTEAIGARLHACTNCGSCLAELKRMLAAAAPAQGRADVKLPLGPNWATHPAL